MRAWTHALVISQPLPLLPLWLADNLAVPLELEATYEETCRILASRDETMLHRAGHAVECYLIQYGVT